MSHYLPLLALSGTIVQLGLVAAPHMVPQLPLIMRRVSIAGSVIGGMKETQVGIQVTSDWGHEGDAGRDSSYFRLAALLKKNNNFHCSVVNRR